MEPLIVALLISAAASVVMTVTILAIVRSEAGRRYAGAIGFAAAFVAAYARLEPRNLSPTAFWHWIPWLAAAAAVTGPISIAKGVHALERWAFSSVVALTAACVLVPARPSLQPVRWTYILIVASGLVVFWNLLDHLARRGTGRTLSAALAVTSLWCSAVVAYHVSLRIGSLGVIGTAALAGGGLAILWTCDATILRGLLPSFGLVLCAVLLTGQLNDGLPQLAPILIPIAPLTLWLFEWGPAKRLRAVPALIAKSLAVATPLAATWFF